MPETDSTPSKVADTESASAASTKATDDDRTDNEKTVTEAEVPAAPQVADGRNWQLSGNDTSGYVGVSPEYRNYASETERPILTDAERERMREAGLYTDDQLAAYPAEPVQDDRVEEVETDTPDDAGEGQADAGIEPKSTEEQPAEEQSEDEKPKTTKAQDDTFVTDL